MAEIIHARGFVNFVQPTNTNSLNVLSRSSLHSISDAEHAPNRATWRPQLRLQMFELPVPSERDLRLIIGCLTARRVSVPRHLASCTVSKNRKVSVAERSGCSHAFFSLCCGWRSVQRTWMCSITVLKDDLISSSLSMRSWCRCLRTIYLLAQSLSD